METELSAAPDALARLPVSGSLQIRNLAHEGSTCIQWTNRNRLERAMTSEKTALVLQGGGALGAYQGGALQALDAAGRTVDWVAGISIGAINAALIAGNSGEHRVAALRTFWNRVSSASVPVGLFEPMLSRSWLNQISAASTTVTGIPGFFRMRVPFAAFGVPGTVGALSYYDTAPLRDT